MDAIFNMFKVRYAQLDQLISDNCHEMTKDSKVNLFINLEPILKRLVSSNIDEYLKVKTNEKSFEMISNIINLAAHYRLFFAKNKIYANVYMYIGYPFKTAYKNRNINPEYRKYYEHKYTKDPKTTILSNTLDNVLPFVKIILEYVEGVYLIESDMIESSLIPNVIMREFPTNNINFVLSTDRYDYQYALKGAYIIRAKQKDSYLVTQSNLMRMVKLEEKIVNDIEVGNNFFPFILSLLGDKYRNIDKIKRVGLGNLLKLIEKAIDENLIGKDVANINLLSKVVKEEFRGLLLTNYYCTDLDTQFQMLNVRDVYSVTSQIIDKFDNVALKKINNDYFKHYPIYLIELTEANNLLRKKRKNDIFL